MNAELVTTSRGRSLTRSPGKGHPEGPSSTAGGTPPTHSLPSTGYLRLHQIIGRPGNPGANPPVPPTPPLIPVSKSTWWAGVRTGRYPQPTRALGPRITAWRVEDIRSLIEQVALGALRREEGISDEK